ncbi:MAG: phosphoribosylamine--glycine ligase [Chloroflexota bacterium]
MVGGGAREHTLVWKIAQSPKVSEIYAAPGNAGTAKLARNLPIKPEDIEALGAKALKNGIDLVVVGPEAPLAAGIVNRFEALGIPTFGATKEAARLESSKVFAKELMAKYGIPCARSQSFSDFDKALKYIETQTLPIVIKADGLAAGKGVVIAETPEQARQSLGDMMRSRIFGTAGDNVLIEECLKGREMSAFAVSDGDTVVPMAAACDYKRVFDRDRGPNTGGMGGYSPPSFFTAALADKVNRTIMQPTIRAMAAENSPYRGVLYGGLMITAEGPKVLEFNARFGDPETQVIIPRLKSDLVELMLAVTGRRLDKVKIEWRDEACVGVVLASGGYPGNYRVGLPISGLDDLDKDILVFHAGTKTGDSGETITSGGRVLTVAATGRTIAEAREKVYHNLPRIRFEGGHYRRDIAETAVI